MKFRRKVGDNCVAKSKADEWLERDKLILLEGWARDGLTDEQIAHNMGIRRETLYDYKNKYPNISNALKKGKEIVDIEVENALLKRALGYTITLKEQKVDKDGCIHDLQKDIHVPGDTTAQIFWLKNRRKQQWRDKVEYEANTDELNKVKELLSKISDGANNG